jgi:hypothetical protein
MTLLGAGKLRMFGDVLGDLPTFPDAFTRNILPGWLISSNIITLSDL